MKKLLVTGVLFILIAWAGGTYLGIHETQEKRHYHQVTVDPEGVGYYVFMKETEFQDFIGRNIIRVKKMRLVK